MLHYDAQQSLYRILALVLGAFLLFLQYQLWLSDQGVQAFYDLKERIVTQEQSNQVLRLHNQQLAQEVKSLYRGGEAFEYHARMKYGLVKKNERYYRF